jgi:hypothetical protein
MNYLPSICKKHPDAKIRHEWDQTHYVMNGYPSGLGTKSNSHYFCSECNLEVCSDEEFKIRMASIQQAQIAPTEQRKASS